MQPKNDVARWCSAVIRPGGVARLAGGSIREGDIAGPDDAGGEDVARGNSANDSDVWEVCVLQPKDDIARCCDAAIRPGGVAR